MDDPTNPYLDPEFHWNQPVELGVWRFVINGDTVEPAPPGYQLEVGEGVSFSGSTVTGAGNIRYVKIPEPRKCLCGFPCERGETRCFECICSQ